MSVTSETIAQAADAPPLHTRGDLTVDFLTSNADPAAHLAQLGQKPDNYGGYNMVCVDLARQEAWALSNRGDRAVTPLAPGLHAMSNGVPQDQWPKMATGKARLQPLLDSIAPDGHNVPWAEMLTVLRDEQQVQDPEELEVTGIVPEVEKQLSSIFVADMQYKGRAYGTRTQTMLVVKRDGTAEWHEHWRIPGTDEWDNYVHSLDLQLDEKAHSDEL